MTTTYTNNGTHEMFVFRVPVELAEKAMKRADKMMVSKSAICRQALQEFMASEDNINVSDKLPQY